jgi:hypothetical protein
MKKTKLMTIPIVLMLALGLTGVAYAHWFDQIHIVGVVHGGTVTLAFTDTVEFPQCFEQWRKLPDDWETRDYWDWPLGNTEEIPFGEFKEKDVGKCTVRYIDEVEDPHTLKTGYKTFIVIIEDAYPSYEAHATFVVHNIGTIPFLLCDYIITGEKTTKADPPQKVCDLVYVPTTGPYVGELWEDYDPDDGELDNLVINIRLVNGKPPYQMDPCDPAKSEFDFHFKQEAQQCHRYKIYINLKAVQWNKECLDDWP